MDGSHDGILILDFEKSQFFTIFFGLQQIIYSINILLMEPEVQGGGDAPLKRARKLTEKAESLLEPVQKVERAKPLKKTTKQTPKAVKPIIATVIKEKAYKVPILNSKDKTCKVLPVNDLHILPSVALSEFDKATQLSLCKDQLVCTGCEVSTQSSS